MALPVHFDLIGDVHGRIDKLDSLLRRLGYRHDGKSHVSPPGRQAIFLGDLIDPKSGHGVAGGVRATLELVKAMTDRGHARCLMGNHELNAIFYHTRGTTTAWLRHRGARNKAMHQGTLDDFPDYQESSGDWLAIWIPWFKTLPMFLDLGGIRAVHACWDPDQLALLDGSSLSDDTFLLTAADLTTSKGKAIEAVLKGVGIPLPPGVDYFDHTGTPRPNFRARWWEMPANGQGCRELVFPANDQIPALPIPAGAESCLRPYPVDAPPVFFGHYFKPADSPLRPERPNVACLDHSAAKDGPLVAYRWQGEAQLVSDHFITHE